MKIGELSRRSGVSPRSLRYYEQHGLIHAERGPNGYREYDDATVERAATIHELFGLGFPRPVVRSVLACSGQAPASAHDDAVVHLARVRDEMAGRIARLSETHRLVNEFLDARGA
ncbi:DNA-binding transcriptional MerR regulator [Diaminobutyricimonas aerilata]|uniref:DNA-binding transcriptional MerR regulator n=1 Tax=Diaminobutyricimonas aerilata TaxID=1162967 RepID=A0A2M9CG23_9MICO|nr:MerR family transcriptional regulator [Diaminobutyricimonas aerilata]PJJ70881.1 DNA-binding transcriptional MerR regulator [Diaminobutyricimonas aerilata]